jgi:hypothetical protein
MGKLFTFGFRLVFGRLPRAGDLPTLRIIHS